MTIEAQLQDISDKLSILITAVQSGAQITAAAETNPVPAAAVEANPAPAAEVEAPAKRGRKPRLKVEEPAAEAPAAEAEVPDDVVDGDLAGTTYFVSDKHRMVVAVTPGEAAPQGVEFVRVPAALYLTKKAEFEPAKNEQPAAVAAPAAADTAPSATAPAATASTSAEPTWDETVAALLTVAKHPKLGNTAVKKLISEIDPTAANVPALKPLGKNAQIVAAANAAVAAVESPDDAALFG